MPRRLLLLTGQLEARFVTTQLARPGDVIRPVASLDELKAALDESEEAARLLAFCTAVIVPEPLLRRLPGPSYNIHPGPPSYPGRHPESWGAYDGCARFGATLHEMAPRVDEGPIVDVEWTGIPPAAGQLEFGRRALRASVALLARWYTRLLDDDGPLPRSEHAWSGRKTTHAQLLAMRQVPADVSSGELERRRRAFAEIPGTRLTLTLHGREFVHTVDEPEPDGTESAASSA
ncbi:MAG TPA: formyltransferase family protein [Stellaceae bacterium]|nr:formyltransferase family protein [Stellaceae bacterium]